MFRKVNLIFTVIMGLCAIKVVKTERCGNVHLTASASYGNNLMMHWNVNCKKGCRYEKYPDTIALYRKDPRNGDGSRAIVRVSSEDIIRRGHFMTNVKFVQAYLPGNWDLQAGRMRSKPGRYCFDYWIASLKDDVVIDAQCFGIQPTWMGDNRNSIGKLRMDELVIPGTHNSGAYDGVSGRLEDYVLCQNRNVWNQLAFGIRYLDLRVGCYGQSYFINHDIKKLLPLEQVLRHITKFVEVSRNEVIVVDFHRFPHPEDFSTDMHEGLANLIYKHLGDYIFPRRGRAPTINEVLAEKKNIIICYANFDIARSKNWMWYPLKQHWADTDNLEGLRRFLLRAINSNQTFENPMTALMTHLTVKEKGWFSGYSGTVTEFANRVNKELSEWYGNQWRSNSRVNIVATDYFLGNDMIDLAIAINKERAK